MNDTLKNKINEFLEQQIDAWDLVDEITYFNTCHPEEKEEALLLLEGDESDRAMIASVLLWALPNSPFQNLTMSKNSFFQFLFSLLNQETDFYNEEIVWYVTTDNILVFQKHDYIFIINNQDEDFDVELPETFQNQDYFCLNCNDEMHFHQYVNVPNCGFYILEKIKD